MQNIDLNNILGDNVGSIQLIQQCGNDKMIVNAARVSFGQDNDLPLNDDDIRLIKYLVRERHTSPFEHNLLTVKVRLPLNIGEQWLRHRIGWSYNKESGRYMDLGEPQFYRPIAYRKQSQSNRQASIDEYVPSTDHHELEVDNYNAYGVELYNHLRKLGVAKEQARMVLPQGLYMSMYATCNLNSLMHFVRLRDHAGAQWEIQQYAKGLKQIAMEYWPVAIKALEETYD